ncbi:MAG TPA: TonB-dependent receptor [Methylomirabilota bacterium]|nr:TonB-dependent receptor [Methylomirabilota bacterium]
MNRLLRGLLVLICMALIAAVLFVCLTRAQEAPPAQAPATTTNPPATTFQIAGTVKSGKTPLPGVTVTASNTLTGKKFSVATAVDGSYLLKGLPRGRYVVKAEFMGFATQTQEITVNPENPAAKVETELVLASRQQEEQASRTANATAAVRGFQNLAVEGTLASLAGNGNGNANGGAMGSASDLASLPMNGAGADLSTDSVSVAGTQGRSQEFGMGNEDELQQRIQEFRDRVQREGGAFGAAMQGGGGPGGPGGPGGGPMGGPMVIGRSRGFNINQPHGFLYFQDDNAGLDAKSYSLNGQQTDKASYNNLRFGAFVGGPLKVPGLFDWSKNTFFAAGWNGSRGGTPYDAYSTVPTEAERNGIFTGLTDAQGNAITIYDPTTGQPFANNVIDPTRISSASTSLLNYMPLPNLPGTTQNFHYVTSANSDTDAASLRLIHNFAAGGGPGFGPVGMGGGGGGFGGGRGGQRGPRNNLSIGFNWSRGITNIVNPFPSLAGSTNTQGWNGSVRWTYGKGRTTNSLSFTYNHLRTATTNLYSGVLDVAGNAGITGVSTDPFDWGLPGLSFNSFSGFSGPIPSRELDQTYTISDTVMWNRGKHNVRFGGDYRWISQGFRSARNGEGSFVFTGFATSAYLPGSTTPVTGTGYDFADFLLGLPQQTSLQSGTTDYEFRATSWDLFVQDDWRILANLSINAGLRYEYNSPFTEAENRIANVDTTFSPSDIAGSRVLPGGTGPYSGVFPDSLVRPDRNNFAPRIGIAWRVKQKTVVRAGYGINYNLAQYGIFIRNFAFQPPFAETATNVSPYGDFLTLENGFPANSQTAVTNNYALNPNYRLGYVQIWNLDIQRQLPWNMQLNVGYNGAKGTGLDTERALVPSCIALGTCADSSTAASAPYIFESSEGSSSLNAASVRIRKRMSKGLGISASYVFSKSLDDASSIGGGSSVVMQNPFDLPAERGLSSFDQTHRFTGNWIYDLPFGDGRRFLTKGTLSHIVGGWQWSGDFTIASGLYFTPRVLGASVDITRGVSGSQRANVVAGQSISIGNPTTAEWFNTGAFCAPGPGCVSPSGGTTYGDAGRNIIEGPAQFTFDMALNKTITIKETRSLELRLQATNIFNTPYFSGLNTTVNSLQFGEITGVASMRRMTMVARFRF